MNEQVECIKQYLLSEFGIHNEVELNEAISKSKLIDISVFTKGGRQNELCK